MVVMIAGVVLERFTAPTMTLWWVVSAMAVGAGLPLFAMLKSPKNKNPGNVPTHQSTGRCAMKPRSACDFKR
ncbi:MAG: hypothetical protein IPJ25_06425 [Rhodocyclaceae bacterium]|nr:hypothetical protein [Rhodocyclaceae bacterium]